MTRIACAQLDVVYGDFQANLDRLSATTAEFHDSDIDVFVFPECFLTGYCVSSQKEAFEIAVPADRLLGAQEVVERTQIIVVVGFAEVFGNNLYNSAALLEPGVKPRVYRKTHLPELGLDNFVDPGDSLDVFETSVGRIGVLICFDLRHPEPTRVLALKGADLIVLPTNWPEGAHAGPNFIAASRAAENRVFLAACNRSGSENGFTFIGQSGIYDVQGQVVAKADTNECVIMAEVDLSTARTKRNVVRPGSYETDVIGSRRPELYSRIVEPG